MPTKIYITGKTSTAGVDQLGEFNHAKERLFKLGYDDVTTAVDGLEDADARAKPHWLDFHLAAREQMVRDADIVLHLENYTHDTYATAEVRLARNHNKNVQDAMTFILAEEAK